MRVVINGESWGIFVNVQQFNKDFVDSSARRAPLEVPAAPRTRRWSTGDECGAQPLQLKSKESERLEHLIRCAGC